MTDTQKRFALVLAALVTLGLIWAAPEPDSTVSEPAKSGARKVATAQVASVSAMPSLPEEERHDLDRTKRLFAPSTWFIAPPVPKVVAPPPPPPPPAPTAPPVPFTYMGKYIEDGVTQVILTRGNRVISGVPGDVIETNYRIERIDANAIVLTYLPLHTTQSVPTGSQP